MQHQNVDVTLVAPRKYEWYAEKSYTYSGGQKKTSHEIDKGNFHRRLISMNQVDWTSDDYKPLLEQIKPDVVYIIGAVLGVIQQIIHLRDMYFPEMKVLNFDMRGLPYLKKPSSRNPITWLRQYRCFLILKPRIDFINKHIDAIFCHYPEAARLFKQEGYEGPVYMQTQVGVNTEWFHPNDETRREIREKFSISDNTYVFGSATRFSKDKGIDDIVNALPVEGDWKYIMMGTGSEDDINRLRALVTARNLEDKIIMPGMIDWYEIAKYWNAVDCAIHVPHTTAGWVETFSLAVIQPQATMKPVIGDDSGSVPYQLGFEEMIVPEGDIKTLNTKIQWVLDHKTEASEIGKKMYERTIRSFSIQSLNDLFYRTLVEDVLQGRYDYGKFDMANVSVK